MNIIIVSKPFSGTRVLRLGERRLQLIAAGAAALVVLAIFGLGTWIGTAFIGPEALRSQLSSTRDELQKQKSEVDRLNGIVMRDMNALAVKLGRIQASSTRINALGERLAKLGKLDDGEFNFSAEPDMGGPAHEPIGVMMPPDQFSNELFRLQRQLAQQSQQLTVLEELLEDRSLDQSLMPTGIPVRHGYISSTFGFRPDPINGSRQFHGGIDFDGELGDDIVAVAGGVVSFAGKKNGYGNVVEIDHGGGFKTRYAHLSRATVGVGQRVAIGTRIAAMGSTGRSTGPHLHYEVWANGRAQNPNRFLKAGEYVQQTP